MKRKGKQMKKAQRKEKLREKGQFWTPDWIAEAMINYLVSEGSTCIFDPAVGTGAFLKAAKKISAENNSKICVSGMEIDPQTLTEAKEHGLSDSDLSEIQLGDFLLNPPEAKFESIVANPPYVRHHRINRATKEVLKKITQKICGFKIDGRAGLHIYFLIQALNLLKKNGKLAFIMPADTVEGVFASRLWKWITKNFSLEAIITFSPEATPFPDVDINPLILLIKNTLATKNTIYWVKVLRSGSSDIKKWISSGFKVRVYNDMQVFERSLHEALKTGLSRPPSTTSQAEHILADFATVMRGVATGANEFFFMTSRQIRELKLPQEFFVRAIGKTRDVSGDRLTLDMLDKLDSKDKPTYLFSPDGRAIKDFPEVVAEYLTRGEKMGLNEKSLLASRKPWYKMEKRSPPPPILFSYLGRRNTRFILNEAGATPLTGFLCVYPHKTKRSFVETLFKVLQHPETVANLRLVGKTYGNGAIKVEPRALERLTLPMHVLKARALTKG